MRALRVGDAALQSCQVMSGEEGGPLPKDPFIGYCQSFYSKMLSF